MLLFINLQITGLPWKQKEAYSFLPGKKREERRSPEEASSGRQARFYTAPDETPLGK